ncbi:MAG TPA: hypothetical protein VMH40_10075 [Myxococcaceae bacterium]|nr:hypothetical protein [Myxococcaceae bacterium]
MSKHAVWNWGLVAFLGIAGDAFAGEHRDHDEDGHLIRVPRDQPTIQAAVDAASDGDRIVVTGGQFCGATLTKRVELVGRQGATIIGCDAPAVGVYRVGFFLPDARASGSSIRGFRFDGRGVSNANLTPIGAAILARSADHVRVVDNDFEGTFQGVTNTDGGGWSVLFNRITHLTALTCDGGCAGGDGIVFQQRLVLDRRPEGNLAAFNHVQGDIPDGLDEFPMTGVFVLGQKRASVVANDFAIPHNPSAQAEGLGVEVSDHCCANVVVSTSVKTDVLFNDGRHSEAVLRVDADAQGGNGNLAGARIFGNRGEVELPPGATPPHARAGLATASSAAGNDPPPQRTVLY